MDSEEIYKHANKLNIRFRILDLVRYCVNENDIYYSLEMGELRSEFKKVLKYYDKTNILDFSNIEKILKNVDVEEKYKQHIKRKIKLLTIKNKTIK